MATGAVVAEEGGAAIGVGLAGGAVDSALGAAVVDDAVAVVVLAVTDLWRTGVAGVGSSAGLVEEVAEQGRSLGDALGVAADLDLQGEFVLAEVLEVVAG